MSANIRVCLACIANQWGSWYNGGNARWYNEMDAIAIAEKKGERNRGSKKSKGREKKETRQNFI